MRKIIHRVRGWISGRKTVTARHAKTAFICIIKPGRQDNADMAAAEQLAMLRRFSSFSDKEDIAVIAIFPGRPTRKVPDGASQGAVSVRYAAADGVLRVADLAIKEAGKTHAVVVVTDQPDVLKLAQADGCTILCTATFEKTLEAVAGPLKRENREPRENRDRREPREPREPRRPVGEAQAATTAETTEAAEVEDQTGDQPAPVAAPAPRRPQPEPHVEKKEKDRAILDLIDPL